MICRKCGKEFEDNNTFCPYCGEKVEEVKEETVDEIDESDSEIQEYEEEEFLNSDDEITGEEEFDEERLDEDNSEEGEEDNGNSHKKSLKVKIIIIIAIIVLLIAGIAGYFVYKSMSKPTMIDLTSVMTTPEFEGIDSIATLKDQVTVDKEKADKLVKSIDEEDRAKAVKKLLESVTYSADKSEDLSNGDEVTFTAHYDAAFAEENKIEVSKTQKKVTVENLATELSVEDIRNSGIIDKLKKDKYLQTDSDTVIYKWLYCKSSKGNIIVAISYYDGIDYSESVDADGNDIETETPVRYWYIANTNSFTKTLDGVHMDTWEIFGQTYWESYDECIAAIKAEGFSIEKIQ